MLLKLQDFDQESYLGWGLCRQRPCILYVLGWGEGGGGEAVFNTPCQWCFLTPMLIKQWIPRSSYCVTLCVCVCNSEVTSETFLYVILLQRYWDSCAPGRPHPARNFQGFQCEGLVSNSLSLSQTLSLSIYISLYISQTLSLSQTQTLSLFFWAKKFTEKPWSFMAWRSVCDGFWYILLCQGVFCRGCLLLMQEATLPTAVEESAST